MSKEDTGSLATASIGVVYLETTCGGTSYCLACTSVQYQMAMNAMPVAVVYVGIGSTLSGQAGPETGDPEKLVRAMYDRDSTELVHNMLECDLYEQETDEYGFERRVHILHGYISAAGPVYSTAPGGSYMQMYFSCVGPLAALMTSPGGTYIESSMSVALERYDMTKPIDGESAQSTGNLYDGLKYTTSQLMEMPDIQNLRNATVARKLAMCVAAARRAKSWLRQKDAPLTPDKDVENAVGGETKLKLDGKNGLQPECDEAYTQQLLDLFMTRMPSSGILGCLQMLPSDAFMLDYIPRWHLDKEGDFKSELCPCTAWKPRRTINLKASDVVSFRMQHDSFQALNTPDIAIATFHELFAYDNNIEVLDTGIIGIAARTNKLQQDLRRICEGQDLAKLNERTADYRVREFSTPRWLGVISSSPDVMDQNKRDNTKSLAVEHTPEKVSEESKGLTDSTVQPAVKKNGGATAWDAANSIASTLFQRSYMSHDVATLEVLPSLRFGCQKDSRNIFFENSLGDTVVVDFTDAVTKMQLSVCGVLQSLSYQYAAGEASTAKYLITLSRVRLDGTQVPVEECPIYTVGAPYDG